MTEPGLLDRKIRDCDAFLKYVKENKELQQKQVKIDVLVNSLAIVWGNVK